MTQVTCPKCGSAAELSEEKAFPKMNVAIVVLGYILVVGVMGYMAHYYGSMPVYTDTSFQFYAFLVLTAVCAFGYPYVMYRIYRTRDVKVIRCATCGHTEVTTPVPSGAKEWQVK